MKQTSIEVVEPEELLLLNEFKAVLDSEPVETSLYVVGDWPRSKFLNGVCYHFELMCYEDNFDRLKGKLFKLLIAQKTSQLFGELKPISKTQKRKNERDLSVIFRLLSLKGNKYKISLNVFKNNSIEKDVISRDFTINSVYLNLRDKSLVEYECALADFERRIIRTIRSPFETFNGQINLFFRFFEFLARYELTVDPDIRLFFSKMNVRRDVFQQAVDFQLSNFNSSAKKFFSKHYLSKMICQMQELGLTDFFIINFRDRGVFEKVLESTVILIDKLELSFLKDFKELIEETYKEGFPKVFYTKARIFLISFVFFRIDPIYSSDFLRVFLYNNKTVPLECLELHKKLHRVLDESIMNQKSTNCVADFNEVISLIEECSFDKSKWGFLYVYKIVSENFGLKDVFMDYDWHT